MDYVAYRIHYYYGVFPNPVIILHPIPSKQFFIAFLFECNALGEEILVDLKHCPREVSQYLFLDIWQ